MSVEQAIGWDWKFGWEVMKRGWKGPLFLASFMPIYSYIRFAFDKEWTFDHMHICTSYSHVYWYVRHAELVRPNFRQELFQEYDKLLEETAKYPEYSLKTMDIEKFRQWCEWVERLKCELEYEELSNTRRSYGLWTDEDRDEIVDEKLQKLLLLRQKRLFEAENKRRLQGKLYEGESEDDVTIFNMDTKQLRTMQTIFDDVTEYGPKHIDDIFLNQIGVDKPDLIVNINKLKEEQRKNQMLND